MTKTCLALLVLAFIAPALAGPGDFTTGPVFEEFGPSADVEATVPLPKNFKPKHSFDVSKAADAGETNRTLVSAARFINMHARAGVKPENISIAVVVHGAAVRDVAQVAEGENANAALIEALTGQGVKIIVCGQSAAYYDVRTSDLLPGVDMALSAMTAHAMLQEQGYTLNPF